MTIKTWFTEKYWEIRNYLENKRMGYPARVLDLVKINNRWQLV